MYTQGQAPKEPRPTPSKTSAQTPMSNSEEQERLEKALEEASTYEEWKEIQSELFPVSPNAIDARLEEVPMEQVVDFDGIFTEMMNQDLWKGKEGEEE